MSSPICFEACFIFYSITSFSVLILSSYFVNFTFISSIYFLTSSSTPNSFTLSFIILDSIPYLARLVSCFRFFNCFSIFSCKAAYMAYLSFIFYSEASKICVSMAWLSPIFGGDYDWSLFETILLFLSIKIDLDRFLIAS